MKFILLSKQLIPNNRKHLVVLGLLCLFLSAAPGVRAQNMTMSLQPGKISVRNLIGEIEKQTDYLVVFSQNEIKTAAEITVAAPSARVSDYLDLLRQVQITYVFDNNYILLKPAAAKTEKTGTVHGKVTGINGEPIHGATVLVIGANMGTITDTSGYYNLSVRDSKAKLQFSYAGYVTQEISVGDREVLNVVLKEDINMLDDIVVIGYGTLEKRAVTSSISSISGKDIPIGMGGSTIASALQGKISGMTINETSSPNSVIDFQLRGVASINATQSPLVVVDGMPGGDIRSLNQEDILSIDVLKDASAGAIYGTRAAGGVILVTTKQANEGPIRITYTSEITTEQVRRRPEMLERDDFLRFGLGSDMGHDTDWYNELVNEWAPSHRHVVNLSGGSRNARIYTTFMHQNQRGIALGDNRKDYSGRINGNFSMFDNLVEIKIHSEYRQAMRDQRSGSSDFNMALWLNPTNTPYDATSSSGYNVWTGGFSDWNPVADIMLKQNDGRDTWLITDATLKVNFTDYLSAQGTVGYQYRTWKNVQYTSAMHRNSIDNGYAGRAYHYYSNTEDKSFEGTINFDKSFGKHTVSAVAGYSFWESNGDTNSMTNYDFSVDGVGAWNMVNGTYLSDGKADMSSYKYPRERLIAFFGRANYSYSDRYMVTASIRREGSSKFGKNNRWGTFWAVSGGWRLSNESFMKDIEWINDLKIRVGYGTTGNNGFSAGRSTRMYTSNSYWLYNGEWIYSYGSARNVNYDLHWETKSELNIGIDYSFLGGRVFGKFDIYHRKVKDMIYSIDAPVPPNVHSTIYTNYGDMENRGWELEIGGIPVKKRHFTYTATMRFSSNKSKVTSLWGNNTYQDRVGFPAPGSPGNGGRLEEGTVIGSYYIWKHAGFTEDGRWLVYDKDDNIILGTNRTYEDKRYVGNAMPKVIIAWENQFQYKNWSLGVSLRSWLKYDVMNTINMYYGLSTVTNQNVLRSAFIENRHIKEEKQLTDYWLEDGSFLKIDHITLGYSLDMKKYQKYMDRINFYFTVRNVACFTKYSGLDPEVKINGLDPGYEWFNNIYPQTRRFTLGAQILF